MSISDNALVNSRLVLLGKSKIIFEGSLAFRPFDPYLRRSPSNSFARVSSCALRASINFQTFLNSRLERFFLTLWSVLIKTGNIIVYVPLLKGVPKKESLILCL